MASPDWLNDISLYHNRGNSSFAGENSELGDFYGLDDLFTENPRVVQGMIDIYADWIRKYRIDGFRIDTVKHVNIEFWEQFIPAIRKVAQDAGIPNFYMFGEVFSTDPSLLSRYTRLGKFDSVLDFGLQSAIKDVFVGEQSGERLHEYLAQDDLHRLASSPQKMMNFVSNHDIGRLAFELKNHFKGANEDELIKRLQLAYAFIYFARGIPVLYYGDEQGFIGTGGDSGAREDMFASKTPRYSAIKHLGAALTPDQPSFDSMHTLYQKLAQFAEIRRQNPGLESGEYSPIRDFGPSILAFRRSLFDSHDEYIVLINLLNTTQDIAWSRIGFSRIYPTGSLDTSLSLPPLSMQILKGPRTKDKPRLAPEAKFTQLDEHQRIAGLFFEELKLGEDARYRVKFSVRTGKEKEFKELYTDLS
ncbi:MAG: alpha-amylase family glycosyl hydrolase, partial [Proteobacteria bacterium]|nr:alpha-amylase family glycosyl hydrolase [Pseudomonadota bacterium]